MKKVLFLPLLCTVLSITACGGSSTNDKNETTLLETTATTISTTEQSAPEKDIHSMLSEIDNWVIGDIWNKGFCDFYHYEEDGKGNTGQTIDIDFSLSKFKESYQKKAEYDKYINSLTDSYGTLKQTWSKLTGEMDRLYDYYKDGVTTSGTSTDTALFVQYMEAFSDDINKALLNETNDNTSAETSSSNNLEVEKGVFDVTINIPAEYVGETTQDELDKKEKEEGYKAVLNDDGSVTYTMTKKQHKEMMKELEESFNKTLSEMVASEDYPNITDIKTNSNYTEFIITTKSNELDLAESLSTLAFYMYGGMYNMFNGTPVDNVHIEFINADSGNIIDSMDSKDSAN